MFEKLKHIGRQCLIKYHFHDMTQQLHDQLRLTLKDLGCRGLPVFAPYVKDDELFYIVDKFVIVPIKLSQVNIVLCEGNAAIRPEIQQQGGAHQNRFRERGARHHHNL